MAEKKNKTKMGRPRKEINEEQFMKLCSILCTEEEIAGYFDCSVDTIERWCKRTYGDTFAEIYKTFSVNGKISLRRAQFRLAESNAGMAIFLGKNYLGQRDNQYQDVKLSGDDGFLEALSITAKDDWSDV